MIDDGSTDNTLRVAQEYAAHDNRVRVFTQPNTGVSAARNHGIRKSEGEYIMFLDSDDWLEDDAVEFLLNAQTKYPDRLIAGDFCNVEEDGTKTPDSKILQPDVLVSIHDIAEYYCCVPGSIGVFHTACGKIFRTKIVSEGIEFPEGIAYSEDAVFEFKYLCKVKGAVYVNHTVYNILQRKGSALRSTYSPTRLQAQIDAYEILINLPEISPEIRKLMSISRTVYITMYLSSGVGENTTGIKRAELAQIREYLKPYVKEYLSYDKVPFKRKVRFLIELYLPVWLGRCVMYSWSLMKHLLKRKPA